LSRPKPTRVVVPIEEEAEEEEEEEEGEEETLLSIAFFWDIMWFIMFQKLKVTLE
jgi:hypothetical protein